MLSHVSEERKSRAGIVLSFLLHLDDILFTTFSGRPSHGIISTPLLDRAGRTWTT